MFYSKIEDCGFHLNFKGISAQLTAKCDIYILIRQHLVIKGIQDWSKSPLQRNAKEVYIENNYWIAQMPVFWELGICVMYVNMQLGTCYVVICKLLISFFFIPTNFICIFFWRPTIYISVFVASPLVPILFSLSRLVFAHFPDLLPLPSILFTSPHHFVVNADGTECDVTADILCTNCWLSFHILGSPGSATYVQELNMESFSTAVGFCFNARHSAFLYLIFPKCFWHLSSLHTPLCFSLIHLSTCFILFILLPAALFLCLLLSLYLCCPLS